MFPTMWNSFIAVYADFSIWYEAVFAHHSPAFLAYVLCSVELTYLANVHLGSHVVEYDH